jgi:hypothetical protein
VVSEHNLQTKRTLAVAPRGIKLNRRFKYCKRATAMPPRRKAPARKNPTLASITRDIKQLCSKKRSDSSDDSSSDESSSESDSDSSCSDCSDRD